MAPTRQRSAFAPPIHAYIVPTRIGRPISVIASPPPVAINVTSTMNQNRPTTKLVIMKSNASHGSAVAINRKGFVGRLGRDSVVAPDEVEVVEADTVLNPS